jgi:hypothetical protein
VVESEVMSAEELAVESPQNEQPQEPAKNLPTTCPEPSEIAVLLAEAGRKGLSVCVEGDGRLRVRGPRGEESLIRTLLGRKPEVLAALCPHPVEVPRTVVSPAAPVPPPDEAAEALAEVAALAPRVKLHWRHYIATRLAVDAGDAERLRRVRDWVVANAELAPPERPDGGAD